MKIRQFIMLLAVVMSATAAYAQGYELSRAKILIDAGDYKEAAITLRPLADNGNAEAQYLASQLFAEGKGVMKSEEQAERYMLLSAKNGYVPAMEEYSDMAYKKQDYPAAYKWMKAANDQDSTTYRKFCIGLYTYRGQGVESDKVKGWKMMYKNKETVEWRNEAVENCHEEFYRHIIDTSLEHPQDMRTNLETVYAEGLGKPEWVDEVSDYFFEQLATLPFEQQTAHFNVWKAKFGSYISVYVYAMMNEKGIGTDRNHNEAYVYTSLLFSRDLNQFPLMKKGTESIVYAYEAGQRVMDNYKVTSVENGQVTLDSTCDGENTFTPQQLADKEVKLWLAKDRYAKKKRNIKVASRAPQIEVLEATTSFSEETLEVKLQVRLKAMNKCQFDASNAQLLTASGRKINGRVSVWGLNTIGSQNNILMPGTIAYVTLRFPGLRNRQEIQEASCFVKTNYGYGKIMALDFAF